MTHGAGVLVRGISAHLNGGRGRGTGGEPPERVDEAGRSCGRPWPAGPAVPHR